VSETDAGDLAPVPPTKRTRFGRWKAIIGLAGLVGLGIAAFSTVDEAQEQVLPGWGSLLAAGAIHLVSLVCVARAWVVLFPDTADRTLLVRALYASQLTKYLPAGGFVQVASQVTLSSEPGGFAVSALRLPVFSLCSVVAAASASSVLVLSDELPVWGRALAGCGVLSVAALDRRLLARLLGAARRLITRLPEPSALPPQAAILRCYGYALLNMVGYATAFAILLGDLADINPVMVGAALAAGWAAGYVVLPLPSGLGVREAVLHLVLPAVATASLLGASLAHRLLGLAAEALMAGQSQLRASINRQDRRPERSGAPAARD
jgi:uncharacterized membrane protein YbhN (UPF0104 family)